VTHTPNWPTREEWEAGERSRAQYCIDEGVNAWDYGQTQLGYTEAERAEVESLAPEAIKAIRRACGRIERQLRQQFPEAGRLAKGITERPITGGAIDRYRAATEKLTGEETEALDELRRVSDIRDGLKREGWWYRPFEAGWTGYESLSLRRQHDYDTLGLVCLQLDRLKEIDQQANTRTREHWQVRGLKVLADLDSGKAWEGQLAHMASVEEYFARGPMRMFAE
jgi:hypothetical protein